MIISNEEGVKNMRKKKEISALNTLNIEKETSLLLYIYRRIYFILYLVGIYCSNFKKKKKKEFLLFIIMYKTIVNYSFDIINHTITIMYVYKHVFR